MIYDLMMKMNLPVDISTSQIVGYNPLKGCGFNLMGGNQFLKECQSEMQDKNHRQSRVSCS